MANRSDNFTDKKKKKGGVGKPFVPGDPRINRKGAPVRGQTWRETVKKNTDLTCRELILIFGARTRVGKFLAKLDPEMPAKDALALAAIGSYFNSPNPRTLDMLMSREEGRPGLALPPKEDANSSFSIPAELIGRNFSDVYRDIRMGLHTEYCFEGGRGSLKSSFVSQVIIMLMINNPEMHVLAMRQVSNTLLGSIYNQLKWAVLVMGLTDKFIFTPSNLEITYVPTNQKIFLRGASDPTNIKSIKPDFGYIGIVWFEEFDQFRGEAAVRNIVQSALRGGDKAYRFESWNTPRTKDHWVHKYKSLPREDRYYHHSTYLETPREWLGEIFLREAEYLKEVNYPAYEHEYLGLANGSGGMVFTNVTNRKITEEEIATFNEALHGLDWGFAVDPASYGKMSYDAARRKLYIYGEYRAWKCSNRELYEALLKNGYSDPSELIIADSAEPKSVADFRKYGANCRGAEKGQDSVRYSIRWLQNLAEIVIDPSLAPHHSEEFTNYEYERNKDGEVISAFPDKNNHGIDDTRYATNLKWRKMGE